MSAAADNKETCAIAEVVVWHVAQREDVLGSALFVGHDGQQPLDPQHMVAEDRIGVYGHHPVVALDEAVPCRQQLEPRHGPRQPPLRVVERQFGLATLSVHFDGSARREVRPVVHEIVAVPHCVPLIDRNRHSVGRQVFLRPLHIGGIVRQRPVVGHDDEHTADCLAVAGAARPETLDAVILHGKEGTRVEPWNARVPPVRAVQ
mmetsp:Transcript_39450/g.108670  ORF Transcript_39450/g.108670 Transcript_39450/m.108670 type:complete len:204 (-) Transcript_39450:440-1051(-)